MSSDPPRRRASWSTIRPGDAREEPYLRGVNYIGVVPEHRARGYVGDLLAAGTAILHAAEAEHVRVDTDTRNLPMAATFRRTGYAEFAKRREYGVKLAPLG